jgi:protein-arginine kinase activator protein McsA
MMCEVCNEEKTTTLYTFSYKGYNIKCEICTACADFLKEGINKRYRILEPLDDVKIKLKR